MQRRRPRVMVADLAARVFGDRAPHTILPVDAAALGSTSTAAADATAPFAADATADAAAPTPTSPPSTRVREHTHKHNEESAIILV
ncbi:hypothetical protein MRB53_026478 [Persea americana]|uniref:Uncharacterized protein n=1 Tax=Persea americana TaxID=3435 RepID=A0ACC2LIB4_PERAE|nr:hypothetical protein MRB53_026478 [Persea americana]